MSPLTYVRVSSGEGQERLLYPHFVEGNFKKGNKLAPCGGRETRTFIVLAEQSLGESLRTEEGRSGMKKMLFFIAVICLGMPFLVCSFGLGSGADESSIEVSMTTQRAEGARDTDDEESLLSRALSIIETMEYARNKSAALLLIADAYIKIGQNDKVGKILSRSLELAETMGSDSPKLTASKVDMLNFIAKRYLELGLGDKTAQLLSQALHLSSRIENPFSKSFALTFIAETYAKLGQNEKAFEVLTQALQIAEKIEDTSDYSQGEVLLAISSVYAEAGQYDRAVEIAKTAKQAGWGFRALIEIVDRCIKAGQKDEACEILSQALQMTKTEGFIYSGIPDEPLVEVATRYAEAGQYDQALLIVETMEEARYRARTLTSIAISYAESGQKDKASQMLSQALQEIETTTPKYPPGSEALLAEIALQYLIVEQKDSAHKVLSEALKVAEIAKTYGYVDDGELVRVVGKYVKAGQCDQALLVVNMIEDPSSKAKALAEVAEKYISTGQNDKADEILSQALRVIEARDLNYVPGNEALAEIAVGYAKSEQYNKALEIVKMIKDTTTKAIALARIDIEYTKAGKERIIKHW